MAARRAEMQLVFDARLLEEAVHLAMRSAGGAPYWREREAIYAIEDEEERGRRFHALARREFETLGLGAPFLEALGEQPLLRERAARLLVTGAVSRRDQGAELFVAPGEHGDAAGEVRSVVVRVRPEWLPRPAGLLSFLRRELLHVADMLDPAFGHQPDLPEASGGPTHLKLILQRYRVLWDTTVDGRLSRRGCAAGGARELREREFAGAFPALGERWREVFAEWFEKVEPTHTLLLDFARDPLAASGLAGANGAAHGEACPLCRALVKTDTTAAALALAAVTREAVQADFPAWQPADGICPQCADLYASRALSLAAARLLPLAAPSA